VPQETIANLRALNHATCEYGKIRRWVITATLLKLAYHLVRPVLRSCFPAIKQDVAQALTVEGSQRLCERISEAAQIRGEVFRTGVVDFITKRCGHCGTILRASKRVAQSQDGPTTRRHFPVELAVLVHLRGQVNDVSTWDCRGRRKQRCGRRLILEQVTEGGLILPAMHATA